MRKKIWRGLIVLVVCLGLPAGYAFAQGKGHGQGGWKDRDKDRDERVERDRDRDRDQARARHVREERRERGEEERHVHRGGPGHVELGHIFPPREPERRPPGWDKGKKTGWGNCDVPPGQAKKIGCEPGRTVHRRRRRRTTAAVNPPNVPPASRRLPPTPVPKGNPPSRPDQH